MSCSGERAWRPAGRRAEESLLGIAFNETRLKGAFVVEPERFNDERGFFARSFCQREFDEHGLESRLVQCNVSQNVLQGTVRGMHMQRPPHGEVKLVRCTRGSLYDVIIDFREDSPTYLEHVGVELTAQNYRMLYIPLGFAHGFMTLEDDTEIFYQMSEFYAPGHAAGYRWNDPVFRIKWPSKVRVISQRDRDYPDFAR